LSSGVDDNSEINNLGVKETFLFGLLNIGCIKHEKHWFINVAR